MKIDKGQQGITEGTYRQQSFLRTMRLVFNYDTASVIRQETLFFAPTACVA